MTIAEARWNQAELRRCQAHRLITMAAHVLAAAWDQLDEGLHERMKNTAAEIRVEANRLLAGGRPS